MQVLSNDISALIEYLIYLRRSKVNLAQNPVSIQASYRHTGKGYMLKGFFP